MRLGARNKPSPHSAPGTPTTAAFAVRGWEETLVAQAAVGAGEVLAVAVRTHASFQTLIDIW